MTSDDAPATGWPGEPGVPLNPERNGWHWTILPGKARAQAVYWADQRYHTCMVKPLWAPAEVHEWAYVGPCLLPAEVAALVAAGQEGMRAWLNDAIAKCHAGRRRYSDACENKAEDCVCDHCMNRRDADIQAMCYAHALDALNALAPDAAAALARRIAEERAKVWEEAEEVVATALTDWRDRIAFADVLEAIDAALRARAAQEKQG